MKLAKLVIIVVCVSFFACPSKLYADDYIDVIKTKDRRAEKLGEMYDNGDPVSLKSFHPKIKPEKAVRIKHVAPSDKKLQPEDLYKKCADSIVSVSKVYKCGKCDKWHASNASGFVIRKDGVIVTNYHVVDKDSKGEAIAVWTRDGRMFPVKDVLATSKENDLAILKVDANLTPLPIAEDAAIGSDVYCISHPVNHLYTMTEGIVAGKFIDKENKMNMAVTCDYAKGSSGAPILDATGAIVGIVRVTAAVYYGKQDGRNDNIQMVWKYCIPSKSLLDLIDGK